MSTPPSGSPHPPRRRPSWRGLALLALLAATTWWAIAQASHDHGATNDHPQHPHEGAYERSIDLGEVRS